MGVNHVEFSNGETIVDLRDDTISPDVVLEGYTGHDAQGNPFVGRATPQENGGAVQEVFWVNWDFDLSTMSISNISVTFREIETALSNGKLVKSKAALLGLNQNAYGDLVASLQNELDFSLFSVINFGTGMQLYHFNLALFADGTANMTIRVVNTTKM